MNYSKTQDARRIAELGGPAKVAALLGYGDGGIQRVHNWIQRGVPALVKLERPDLFPRAKPAKRARAFADQGV